MFGKATCDVARNKAILSHDFWLQPDAERVIGGKGKNLTYTLNTLQLRRDIDGHVVAHEVGIVLRNFTHHGINLQHGSLTFEGGNTNHGHLLR